MIIVCPRCKASYEVNVAAFGVHARLVQCSACRFRWSQRPEESREAGNLEDPATSTRQDGVDDWKDTVESPPESKEQTAAAIPESGPDLAESDPAAGQTVSADSRDDKAAEVGDEVHPLPLSPEKGLAEGKPPVDPSPGQPLTPVRRRRTGAVAAAAAATILALIALLVLLREPIVTAMPGAAGVYELVGLAPDSLGKGLEIRDVASARERVDGKEVMTVTGIVANVAQSREVLPPLRVTLYDSADEELQFVTVSHAQQDLDAGQAVRFETRISPANLEARRLRVGFAPEP